MSVFLNADRMQLSNEIIRADDVVEEEIGAGCLIAAHPVRGNVRGSPPEKIILNILIDRGAEDHGRILSLIPHDPETVEVPERDIVSVVAVYKDNPFTGEHIAALQNLSPFEKD